MPTINFTWPNKPSLNAPLSVSTTERTAVKWKQRNKIDNHRSLFKWTFSVDSISTKSVAFKAAGFDSG